MLSSPRIFGLALIFILMFSVVPLPITYDTTAYSLIKSGNPKTIDVTCDWSFKIDPNELGEQEGWYALEYNDSDWIQIDAGVMWEDELGYDYNGWGWYRKWVDIPSDWANHSVVIYIGAADDSAWIYTNGNLSGTHLGEELRDEDPLWWQHPFYINISKEILPGEPNLIAVKVDDWGGGGGMWKPPIALTTQPPESLIFDRSQFFKSLVASHPDWVWPRWAQYEGTATASNSRYKAWSIIGVKGYRYEALVGPDSSIMPNKNSYTITSWLYDHSEGKFYAPENILTSNFGLQQSLISLLEGYLPITQAEWTAGEIGVKNVHFADVIDGKDVIFTKIELENHATALREASLYIAVRPYGPRLGTVTVYSMAYNSTLNYLSVDGKLGLVLQGTPYNWGFYAIEEGDVSVNASQGQLSGYASCVDLRGFCTGAVEYRFELEPNETINVVFKAPVEKLEIDESVVNQLREADFDSHFEQVKTSWESLLFGGMKISLPEERVVNNFYASLAYLMILEDGRELHPGPSSYDSFWFRDAAYMVNALDKAGLFNESNPCLDYFIEKQWSDGWFFSQSTEWDSNGEAMWALIQHYRLTGNLSWLQEVYPSIRKGAIWLQQKRMETKKESDVGTTHYGLLPQGASAEDIGPSNVYHYWDDFWGICGLRSAIYAANVLNETDDLEWLTPEYNDFLNCTLESIKKTLAEQGISHIPCGPDHGFYESWAARGTSVCLWPTSTLNVSDTLVQDSFNYYWSTFFIDGGFVHEDSGNCFWPYVTMALAHDFMLLEWDDKALSSFSWVLDHPCAPSAWCELQDQSTKLGALGEGWGDEPHGWACAEYILLVRDMLLMEEGSKLLLTPCINQSWLVNGSVISVKNAPTFFGKVNFTIQSHLADDYISVIISPEQDPPDGYVLELPTFRNIVAVGVDGNPLTNFSGGIIHLPSGSREITVWYAGTRSAFNVTVDEETYNVTTFSSSVIANFSYCQHLNQISFNATGPSGTTGFCNITLPKELGNDTFMVLVDNVPVDHIQTENQTHYFLYFTYIHSAHIIKIIAGVLVHSFTNTIYEISFNINTTLNQGTNLTIRFYSYSGEFQAGSMVWNGTTPAHIELSNQVLHPLGLPVEVASLVLTYENGTIISIVTTFAMRRSHMMARLTQLDMLWIANLGTRPAMFSEIVDIDAQWPYAPS